MKELDSVSGLILLLKRIRSYNEFPLLISELMDLCDPVKFKQFISWDGDSINLQHFKLERISRKYLQNLDESNKMQ